MDVDAAIVVDGSADEIIERMLATGWTLHEQVDVIAGKRIRYLSPPETQGVSSVHL